MGVQASRGDGPRIFFIQYSRSYSSFSPTDLDRVAPEICHRAWLISSEVSNASPHKLQLGFETVRHLASVVPSDGHPVNVGSFAYYQTGAFPPAQAYSRPEEQWLGVGTITRKGLGAHAEHSLKDSRAARASRCRLQAP